jgi:hypothetical protein
MGWTYGTKPTYRPCSTMSGIGASEDPCGGARLDQAGIDCKNVVANETRRHARTAED